MFNFQLGNKVVGCSIVWLNLTCSFEINTSRRLEYTPSWLKYFFLQKPEESVLGYFENHLVEGMHPSFGSNMVYLLYPTHISRSFRFSRLSFWMPFVHYIAFMASHSSLKLSPSSLICTFLYINFNPNGTFITFRYINEEVVSCLKRRKKNTTPILEGNFNCFCKGNFHLQISCHLSVSYTAWIQTV